MKKNFYDFERNQSAWLWWLALFCAASGASIIYVLENKMSPATTNPMFTTLAISATFLSTGLCVICALSRFWIRR